MKELAYRYFLDKLKSKTDASDRILKSQDFNEYDIRRVHFVGICGKAMASLAGLFVKAGYDVTGSDDAWNPPMSTMLEHIGIRGSIFTPENLLNIDLVVMGNAFSASNTEAVEARKRNIPQISSAEAYARFFIKDARSIVVAGTHGKTTTSSLGAHIFIESGKSTNVLVGGVLRNSGKSYHFTSRDPAYSVVEGDEYDTAYFDKAPKFLHYRPTVGIITSIEFDHADIYTDMEDYLAAFVFFAQEIPTNGYLLVSESVKKEYREKLQQVCGVGVYTYGFSEKCDVRAQNVRIDRDREGQVFDIEFEGKKYEDFFVPLFGAYNAENTLAIVVTALKEGIGEKVIKESLSSFKGAEQRQQILYDQNGIVVMNDFAHHPTAVSVTLRGIRDQYPDTRIIAIFEPRSATSRRKDFEEPYMHSFSASNIVILAKPAMRAVDTKDAMMDISTVVAGIKNDGKEVYSFDTMGEIFQKVQHIVQRNDVVVIMSNGYFDGLPEKVVQWLSKP